MPLAPRGVLFDLDGTLVDHFATPYRCYHDTFAHFGLPPPDESTVRRSVGGSMEITMAKLMPDAELRSAAADWWRRHFEKIFLEDVHAFPGALWILQELHQRGLKLCVLTNKIGEQSRGICAHLGFDSCLDFVLGAEDTPYRKPQRQFSEHALERLGVNPSEAVLVGDSPHDIEAARSAGIRVMCVTTGTHSAEELHAAGADGVYTDLFALGKAVFGLKT
ncbi:MAG: HAD family hydrolase [Opitutaceae bacterium]